MPLDNQGLLLAQFLSAAGQDIGSGNPLGANVHAATMQNIQARSYAKLLQQLLGGGGKISMDKDNVSIKAPAAAFGSNSKVPLSPGMTPNTDDPTTQARAGSLVPQQSTAPKTSAADTSENDMMTKLALLGGLNLNPSASPLGDISPSDLAGLTPQDISQALQFKFSQDEVGRQSINDLVNNAYKMSLISQGEASNQLAQLKELRQWEELMKQSPLSVPGLGSLDLDTWDKLPTDVKAYSYYAFNAQQNGEQVLSYNEFKQQADPASMIQYYELAKKDPDFEEFYLKSKAAGATKITLEQKTEQKRALDWVELESKLAADLSKLKLDRGFRTEVMQYDPNDPKYKEFATEEDYRAFLLGNYIKDQVRSRGEIVSEEISEDGIYTVTVKTKAGTTETLSYDIFK